MGKSAENSERRGVCGRASTLLPVTALRAFSGSLTSDENILAGDGASLKYATVLTKRPKSHGRSGSAAKHIGVLNAPAAL